MLVSMSSCTIDESFVSESSDAGRLVSVDVSGVSPLISNEYDDLGRIVSHQMGKDLFYTFTYTSNADKYPATVEIDEFDVYTDKYDNEVRYLMCRSRWSEIGYTKEGFISSMTVSKESYSVRFDRTGSPYVQLEPPTPATKGAASYDADGHVLSFTTAEGVTPMEFAWDGAALLSSTQPAELGVGSPTVIHYQYLENDNAAGQWCPLLDPLGSLWSLGFLGRAPEKFVKAEDFYLGDKLQESVLFDYQLNANGSIGACKMQSAGVPLILTFRYEK